MTHAQHSMPSIALRHGMLHNVVSVLWPVSHDIDTKQYVICYYVVPPTNYAYLAICLWNPRNQGEALILFGEGPRHFTPIAYL